MKKILILLVFAQLFVTNLSAQTAKNFQVYTVEEILAHKIYWSSSNHYFNGAIQPNKLLTPDSLVAAFGANTDTRLANIRYINDSLVYDLKNVLTNTTLSTIYVDNAKPRTNYVKTNDSTYVHTNFDGSTSTIIVPVAKAIPTLVDNGNGTLTYNNFVSPALTFQKGWTTLVNNPNGSSTFTYPDGSTITTAIPTTDTDIKHQFSIINDSIRIDSVDNRTGLVIGTPQFIDNVINKAETITTLGSTIAGHKIGDYSNEAGTVVDINESVIGVVNNPNGSTTITKEDGTTVTTAIPTADTDIKQRFSIVNDSIRIDSIDNKTGLVTGTPQYLDNVINQPETVTILGATITGHKIGDYTNEVGSVVNINESVIGVVNNPNGSTTITKEDGTTVTTAIPTVDTDVKQRFSIVNDSIRVDSIDNKTGLVIGTPQYLDNVINQPETITTLGGTISGHKIGDYTNESGTVVNINESVIGVVNNPNGSTTITKEDGTSVTTAVPAADTDIKHRFAIVNDSIRIDSIDNKTGLPIGTPQYLDNVINQPETITTLGGTISGHKIGDYTNESGTVVNINESVIGVVNNPNGSTTITKEDGTSITTAIPSINTDIKHIFTVVNDSIRIDSLDNLTGSVVGTPQFIDNVINAPDAIQTAANDLRLDGATVVRGSDSPTLPKGSAFSGNIYNHTVGFSDNWIGAAGSTLPTVNINDDGVVRFNSDDDSDVGVLVYKFNPANFSVYQGVPLNSTAYTNQGQYGTVSGGYRNYQESLAGTIAGGALNQLNGGGTAHTISGGTGNTVTGPQTSAIGGGNTNSINGESSVISGGSVNTITGSNATISGGGNNSTSADFATVGGGNTNNVSGSYSVVAGGRLNTQTSAYDFIGGGFQNSVSDSFSVVAGGRNNTASAQYIAIGGGLQNNVSSIYSTVSGGRQNTVSGDYGAIGGGSTNTNSGAYAYIGGGLLNTATAFSGVTVGGFLNNSTSTFSFIGAGSENNASASAAAIVAGSNNVASGAQSFIGSGTLNTASGLTSMVVGGQQNKATVDNALIFGGFQNTASAYGAIIVGGQQDTVTGANGFIAGGLKNKVSGVQAFNGTGDNNSVQSESAFNGAGSGNTVIGEKGFNAAGEANTVTSKFQANFGMNNVAFSGQAPSGSIVRTDLLFTVGNGDGTTSSTSSNALTMLKNGNTQINNEAVYPKSQSMLTPSAVLDVVSTTSGTLAPRLTSAQVTTLLASLNLTTDVTGGVNGSAYSKKGMEVECVDCASLDGSTSGVTLKLYPNAALTAWVAKKMW